MIHRGPDGSGITHIPNQAIFGHRRLAIIDLDKGQQPMVSSMSGIPSYLTVRSIITLSFVTNSKLMELYLKRIQTRKYYLEF